MAQAVRLGTPGGMGRRRVEGTAMYSAKAPMEAPKTRVPIFNCWSVVVVGLEDDFGGGDDEGSCSIVPAKS